MGHLCLYFRFHWKPGCWVLGVNFVFDHIQCGGISQDLMVVVEGCSGSAAPQTSRLPPGVGGSPAPLTLQARLGLFIWPSRRGEWVTRVQWGMEKAKGWGRVGQPDRLRGWLKKQPHQPNKYLMATAA